MEFRGDKGGNNLIGLPETEGVYAVVVLHETREDSEAAFKMMYKIKKEGATAIRTCVSADGIHWSQPRETGLSVEFSGLTRWNGAYHLTGGVIERTHNYICCLPV